MTVEPADEGRKAFVDCILALMTGMRALVWLAPLVASGGVLACRQLVGIQDQPPAAPASDDAAGGGVCSADAGACASCLGASCCAQLTACDAEVTCKQSLDCLLGCGAGDEACSAACVQGLDGPLAAVLSCRAQSCATECGVSCGGILGALYPDVLAGSPDCASCATSQVCTDLTTCAASTNCVSYAACTHRDCVPLDRACATACQYAVGPSLPGDAVLSALKTHCTTECRLGSNFDCVGKRAWPVGVIDSTATFSTHYSDTVGTTAMAGVFVRLCPLADPTCATEWDHATTDSTGYASVSGRLSQQGNGNAGVFNGYVDLSDGGVYPTVAIIFPPLAGSLAGSADYTPYLAQTFSAHDVSLLTSVLPVPLDPTRGHVVISALDCLQVPAAGMTFQMVPPDGALIVYVRSGVPSVQATATDVTGTAAILNVLPGPITVSTHVAATGALVSQHSAFVRAQTITQIAGAPLPP
jgi:hypothetical protein